MYLCARSHYPEGELWSRTIISAVAIKMQASKQLGTVICRTSSAVRSRIVASTVTAPKFSVSQIRFFKSTPKSMTKVTQNSWAVERLEELGEKLEPGDVIPPTELSDEILYNPSPKVLKLADELLACNMVESNQVWRTIQVIIS